ncbi:conserved hypothetical protein [Candidatus Terasakiella magnetica]|uniref:GST N-terminal domain-containing protein n=1 Tax=Candidatus Terasakiella magnetica TaxID=1867952 RepID=A0A1C3RFQ7_9PROT|nr:glutathione S-transferase [Candidatus Terasakiella magnetica]SCA56052.1 conserved hypothetical protein [Candidatus Terasakiella magnetica]
MSTQQIIFHHYPQSPVSEKVRIIFGMKNLTWKSVLIPRLPPKTNLTPLTGGYRLTPVMQIGADIYCDTKCIIQELEHRFPTPNFFPDHLSCGLGQWTDGPLFKDVVTVALVEMSPNMPPEFLADRGPLYFGPDFSLDDIKAKYNESLSNIRTQFGWIDKTLQSRDFLNGPNSGLSDALVYYLLWFLRDRLLKDNPFLQQFPNLMEWAERIDTIGHGTSDDMSDLDALEIARKAQPQTPEQEDPLDPFGLQVGEKIAISPVAGGPKVEGALHHLCADRMTLLREDEQVGQVCVHFPRLGYRVERTSDKQE